MACEVDERCDRFEGSKRFGDLHDREPRIDDASVGLGSEKVVVDEYPTIGDAKAIVFGVDSQGQSFAVRGCEFDSRRLHVGSGLIDAVRYRFVHEIEITKIDSRREGIRAPDTERVRSFVLMRTRNDDVVDARLGVDEGANRFDLRIEVSDEVDRYDRDSTVRSVDDDSARPDLIVVARRLAIVAEASDVDRLRMVDDSGPAKCRFVFIDEARTDRRYVDGADTGRHGRDARAGEAEGRQAIDAAVHVEKSTERKVSTTDEAQAQPAPERATQRKTIVEISVTSGLDGGQLAGAQVELGFTREGSDEEELHLLESDEHGRVRLALGPGAIGELRMLAWSRRMTGGPAYLDIQPDVHNFDALELSLSFEVAGCVVDGAERRGLHGRMWGGSAGRGWARFGPACGCGS